MVIVHPAPMNEHPSRPPRSANPLPPTRRRFLTTSLGVFGGSYLIARNARAAVSAAPAAIGTSRLDRKIKLGVVGCGGRGAWIANLFRKHGGYDMFAVADYFPEVAQRVGEALGTAVSRRFSGLSGYRKLIESGVEAVALETPPCFFPEHARLAVDAGLHVYMAKPVAVDVPGCLAVEQAANDATSHRQCFLVDYQLPTDPHNRAIVEMIEQGDLGKIVTLNSHYYAGSFPDPPMTSTLAGRLQKLIWVNDVPIGASYHVNACIHAIDAALWVAGSRPLSAVGMGFTARPQPHGDSQDVYSILFEFPDGRCLNHRGKHLENQTGFDVACEIQGEVGHAEIRYGGEAFLKSKLNGYSGEVENLYEAGAVRNIDRFHHQLLEGDASNQTVQRAIDGALTTILGREAARRRKRITLAELIQENQQLEIDRSGLVD